MRPHATQLLFPNLMFLIIWLDEHCLFSFQLTTVSDLKSFVNLNLAIVYLRTNRQTELVGLLESIDPEKLESG